MNANPKAPNNEFLCPGDTWTDTWTDKYGNEHRLDYMTQGYLENVLSFLEEKAGDYFIAEVEEVTRQQAVAAFGP
jgi:hypothetical protein